MTNYMALVAAVATLCEGAVQAAEIENNQSLSDTDKRTQLAVLAAADLPRLVEGVATAYDLAVPSQVAAVLANVAFEAQAIGAVEAGVSLLMSLIPKKV